MTSGIDETPLTPPAAGAASPRKSGIQRIFGALFNPGETFAEIAERPDFLAPLVLIIVVCLISAVVVVPRVDFESVVREQLAQSNPDMSADDADRAARMGGAFAKVMAYASPLLTLILAVIIAAILLFAFRLMGGEGTFKQAFSVTLYSWMPAMVAAVVGAAILLGRGTVTAEELQTMVMSNPGFLVDPKENVVAFALLSSIDLFTIWTIILLVFGFSAVARVSRTRAAIIVVSLWVVLIICKVGFAALGASRMKA